MRTSHLVLAACLCIAAHATHAMFASEAECLRSVGIARSIANEMSSGVSQNEMRRRYSILPEAHPVIAFVYARSQKQEQQIVVEYEAACRHAHHSQPDAPQLRSIPQEQSGIEKIDRPDIDSLIMKLGIQQSALAASCSAIRGQRMAVEGVSTITDLVTILSGRMPSTEAREQALMRDFECFSPGIEALEPLLRDIHLHPQACKRLRDAVALHMKAWIEAILKPVNPQSVGTALDNRNLRSFRLC